MHRTHLIRSLGLAVLALTCSTLRPGTPADAAGRPATSIELRPSDAQGNVLAGQGYYQLVARPGATVRLYAFVGNRGRQQAGIDLVPVDATSGEYGAISYDLPKQARRMVGAWVTLSHRWVSLGPDRGMVVPFSVHVPSTARSGQYIGGLSAFVPAPRARAEHGIGLTVQTRVLDAIEITIPGRTRAALGVVGAKARYRSNDLYVLVHLRNTGTVLLKGQGYLWVYAAHRSTPWIHRSFAIDTTVPGTSIYYPLRWAHRVPAGEYRYAVSVTWGAGTYRTDVLTKALHWRSGHATRRGVLRAP
jgi:hypothetical protein